MPRIAALALVLISFFPSSRSAPAREPALLVGEHPIWVAIGAAGGGTAQEVGGIGHASITLGLRLIPVVPELTLREGVASGPTRHITGIAAGARFLFPEVKGIRPFARIAFAHQHELPWRYFKKAPAQALLGIHAEMTHRTGFETGGGIEAVFGRRRMVGVWVQATAVVLPATHGPDLYVLGEAGISIAVGPPVRQR
jgi:hypothetical protein